ncbi:asparaginase [Paenibacillus eucommiae]|uniref:L-asparaginase II n=1 Tax=Paenibacillus eucommiae TaxID=1355755 RepID=A0ABS4J9F3_9BACL|nr:asparaginase [Paenibacillus eucommiae]MBP1996470.1 L-asparaginase II [Paenibacillus eucommiae]
MKPSAAIVHVNRGPLTESIHHGHIAVVNNQGRLLGQLGYAGFLTFARSTAKLLQAIPVIESGAADHYQLSDAEIALLCASHNGEAEHTTAAASILTKLQLNSDHLQCGIHEPWHVPTALRLRAAHSAPTPLHNNCSGKHCGMLTLAAHMNVSHENYLHAAHPVQQQMLNIISEMSGVERAHIKLGIDGCGVPVFGIGIDSLALAYAKLGCPGDLSTKRAAACNRIRRAISKHPHYLAGSDRFDTCLVQVTQGRIIGKMGAEGVFALAAADAGLGIAIKVEDGSERALYPTVVETLLQLDLLSLSELEALSAFHYPLLRNWQGTEVGSIRPQFRLHFV